MNASDKHLALFACIEPGVAFWSREIAERGIETVYTRITSRAYDTVKYASLIEKISLFDLSVARDSIAKAGGVFISFNDENWPSSLNDLEVPPLGLIVKGDVALLTQRSLAIVGTRNPTPYGIRIA